MLRKPEAIIASYDLLFARIYVIFILFHADCLLYGVMSIHSFLQYLKIHQLFLMMESFMSMNTQENTVCV